MILLIRQNKIVVIKNDLIIKKGEKFENTWGQR
jgi:hypothetical protein